jgi:hypothetical protein
LFHIGLAILWVLRKEILRKKDFFQVLDCVERGCKELTDFSELKLALNKKNLRIKSALIAKLRNIYEDEVLAEYSEKFNRVIDPYVLIRSINQYCKDDNECKQKVLFTSGFFTFKLCDVSVIDGFIDNHSYPKIVNSSYLRENEQIYTFGKKTIAVCLNLEWMSFLMMKRKSILLEGTLGLVLKNLLRKFLVRLI